jgi:hypothetical protein
MTENINTIIGNWTLIRENSFEVGVGQERYSSDGTKTSTSTLYQINKPPLVIKATSSWVISKNILTETVIEIDKKAIKKFGTKKGHKIRSYIKSITADVLELDLLTVNGKAQNMRVTLYREK